MNTNTCILYFTLTPNQEAKTKKWSGSNRVNLHIAKHLYAYSKAQIQKVNLPFIEVNETQQEGKNFGQKIVHAIDEVFAQGYEDVIVVGNDCINFDHKDLSRAEQLIATGHQTIGLTKDGGVYLFSIHKAAHTAENADILSQLPWCTPQLGQSLYNFLQDLGEVASLATKIDLDDEQTLINALGYDLPSTLVRILRQLLSFIFYKKPYHFIFRISPYLLKGIFFRGPPLLS